MAHVTIHDVARHSGYGKSTVARALTGRGSVSRKAQERIEASAKALGYRPDPALSALSNYRARLGHEQRNQTARTEIEVMGHSIHRRRSEYDPLTRGMMEQAEAYGFELHFSDPPRSPSKLKQLFTQAAYRNVRYIIFFPDHRIHLKEVRMDLSGFDIISLSNTWETFGHHVVAPDHFANTYRACELLRDQGAQRIGLVTMGESETRGGHKFSGAGNAFQQQTQDAPHRIPPLILDTPTFNEAIQAWMRLYDPDTLLCAGYLQKQMITRVRKCAGTRNVVSLYDLHPPLPPVMSRRREAMGRDTIHLVKQLMLMHIHNLPKNPIHLYIPGELLIDGPDSATV